MALIKVPSVSLAMILTCQMNRLAVKALNRHSLTRKQILRLLIKVDCLLMQRISITLLPHISHAMINSLMDTLCMEALYDKLRRDSFLIDTFTGLKRSFISNVVPRQRKSQKLFIVTSSG